LEEVKQSLRCSVHGGPIDVAPSVDGGVPWPDSQLQCAEGCVFEVEGGIPRFVARDHYAQAFGLQWQQYQQTQLDSYSGQPISRRRLERCLGMPVEALGGKSVLEVGAGAGRFTELLIENAGLLVSMDLSEAVDANLKNCGQREHSYLLVQGDVNASPLPRRFFDMVICLGVIQHTPSPEQTIASLVEHLAPGGTLVIDHYTLTNRFNWLGRRLTLRFPLRAVLKRVSPGVGLKATRALTAVCDPIRKRTSRVPWLDRIALRLFPTACYYNRYPELGPALIREWNELDTHDQLTAYYRHVRSVDQLSSQMSGLGLVKIRCERGGNGVEARGTYPG
jgi:SAM-dependent methyltransferase